MRFLAVTNIYPSVRASSLGTFVEQQIKGLRDIGIIVEVMFVERIPKGMFAYLGLGKWLREQITDFQPDVVHAMYGGIMADVVTRTVDDRPTVVSFCGSDLLGENFSGYLRKIVASYGVWASCKAAQRASGIVVKSRNLLDSLPDGIQRSKVIIIPNGIDLVRFKPLDRDLCRKQLGWRADRFHVLFPNSGDPCKRPDLARDAVKAVNNLGIDTEIHQLRGVPHSEVPIWLNACEVVLLTSEQEGSPNIIKEDLASDLPVVSVDAGDVQERIQGIEGCYLALAKPYDLATKLSLVHAGARRVKGRVMMEEISLSRISFRLKEFYEGLLSRPKNQ